MFWVMGVLNTEWWVLMQVQMQVAQVQVERKVQEEQKTSVQVNPLQL